MYNPEQLIYHQATFDLVERKPVRRPDAEAVLARCEQALGFPLPAAVREWYSLRDAIPLMGHYSNEDQPIDLAEMVTMRQTFGQNWKPPIDFQEKLPIILENQWVALWALHLDGSADPPIVVWGDWDYEGDEGVPNDGVSDPDCAWRPCADHFSSFICQWVWDHLYWAQECILRAEDGPLAATDFAWLRATFTDVGSYAATSPIHHYRADDQHIYLWEKDPQHTSWWLRAATKESLLALTQQVWHCGTLARTLHFYGGYLHNSAGKVLEIMRVGHEVPEDTNPLDWSVYRPQN